MGYLERAQRMEKCAEEARNLGDEDIAKSFMRVAQCFRDVDKLECSK